MKITKDILYAGVNDHTIDLFEGQYAVPDGMSYHSYVIKDEKTAVLDTVDARFSDEWLRRVEDALDGRAPDYLIVQHMEPDHSANIARFTAAYPQAVVVASAKAFAMMAQFYKQDYAQKRVIVKDGDTLPLGGHTLHFIAAPMVHWPEVILTYDDRDGVLFSADAFGRFGTPDDGADWADEACRYYIGIVGKYGLSVQTLLKKASALKINLICPLHGDILRGDMIAGAINHYDLWSSYRPERKGVVVAYTSIYGHTKKACEALCAILRDKGADVRLYDLARCDMASAVADAFRYDRLVLATTTYNGDIFPFMRTFIEHLTERGFKDRTVGMVENGTWAPVAAKVMKGLLAECAGLCYTENNVKIKSAMDEESENQIKLLAEELTK